MGIVRGMKQCRCDMGCDTVRRVVGKARQGGQLDGRWDDGISHGMVACYGVMVWEVWRYDAMVWSMVWDGGMMQWYGAWYGMVV